MVAAFASEYQLATLVGTTTAGRLVATSAFKVGFGYRVVMPVATYFTWQGTNLEGRGLAPTIEEPFSFEASVQGRDNQLERATQIVRETERASSGASRLAARVTPVQRTRSGNICHSPPSRLNVS